MYYTFARTTVTLGHLKARVARDMHCRGDCVRLRGADNVVRVTLSYIAYHGEVRGSQAEIPAVHIKSRHCCCADHSALLLFLHGQAYNHDDMYLDSIGSQQTYHVTLLAQPDDETAHFDQRHFEPAPYLKSGT